LPPRKKTPRLASAWREAEARATTSAAVADGNVQALNYFIAQKYVEAMTQIGQSANARLVLMPMETAGLVGTIAGITELAKNGVLRRGETVS
jgi:regulator of protease activity HflC (stomatin/prohibitin superfamily)